MSLKDISLLRAVTILAFLIYMLVGPIQLTIYTEFGYTYVYASFWYYQSNIAPQLVVMYQYAIPVWILCGLVLFAFTRGFRKNYRAVKAGTRPSKRFRKGCKLASIFSVGTAIFSVIYQLTYTSYGATIVFLGMPVSITAAVITTAISFEHPKLFAKDFWAQSYQAQAPSAPKGPLPREEIEKQMRTRAERLKTIVQVSKRLKVARIAEVLEMDEKELWKHIFDWAKEFGFQIDDDMVTFNVDQVDAFIKKLDSEFETWTRSADKTN